MDVEGGGEPVEELALGGSLFFVEADHFSGEVGEEVVDYVGFFGGLGEVVVDEAEDAGLVVFVEAALVEVFGFFEVVGALVGGEGEVDATDRNVFHENITWYEKATPYLRKRKVIVKIHHATI